MLGRDQTQPCRQLSTVLELGGIADTGDHGICGQRADAGELLHPHATLVSPRLGGDMSVALGQSLAQLPRSEEHTSELQSLMRTSYAPFCLKKKTNSRIQQTNTQ